MKSRVNFYRIMGGKKLFEPFLVKASLFSERFDGTFIAHAHQQIEARET